MSPTRQKIAMNIITCYVIVCISKKLSIWMLITYVLAARYIRHFPNIVFKFFIVTSMMIQSSKRATGFGISRNIQQIGGNLSYVSHHCIPHYFYLLNFVFFSYLNVFSLYYFFTSYIFVL